MFRGVPLAALVLAPSPLLAQVAAPPPSARTAPDFHSGESRDIIITGFRRERSDVLSGTSVLTGEQLTRDLRPTLGETLARQPGVSATSFGPNASRPVLRGFQGERVRVLTDGIGSLDVSNTSVDHAVAINPLTAERIEVLRGPAALLFGSSAIGGVVNVVDARIPRRVPEEPIHLEAIATYGSAADERSVNGAVDVPLGSRFVLHADANYVKTDDLEIGGFVLSRPLRAEAAASPSEEVRALASLRGRLPNSQSRTWEVAGGAAYVSGGTNAGLSISRYDSLYGIPVRYSLDPAEEAEAVRLDIRQTRVDGRAEIDLGDGFLDSLRLRGGYADYEHDELEETGEIGTTFFNEAHEARLELVQNVRGGWGGGFGVQYFDRQLSAVGEEKYIPASETEQIGLFTVQSYVSGPFRAEIGGRYEHSRVAARADADLGNPDIQRSFDAISGSAGASYALGSGVRLGLNLSHSQRAPAAEELYPNGPHAGTQAFEIGDPGLSKEKSWGLEGTLRASGDGYSLGASVFHSWFDNYIFERRTGAEEDGLPVFQFAQDDARYFGVELEASVRVARLGSTAISLDGVADYVRARIDGFGPAPRIPPFRVLGGVEAQNDRLTGRFEVEHAAAQERLAEFETRTPAYTMVNASLAWRPFRDHRERSLTISANNLFDVTARRHASFLKDYAPLAGRDIRLTARFGF